MKKRYTISKKKFRELLIISFFVCAALILTLVRYNHVRTEKELQERKKQAEASLDADQKAKSICTVIDGKTFTVIAHHKIDLDKALTLYLKKDHRDFKLKLKGDFDYDIPGRYSLSATIKDKADVSKKADFTVKAIAIDDPGDFEFLTQKGFIGQRKNGIATIGGIKIVNKTFSIPPKYGNQITQSTVDSYFEMEEAAARDGISLVIQSDYRSYKDQQVVYKGYVKKSGQKAADQYSARPGHSEHQLGEALDLNDINQSFADTPEGQWLNKNCSKFGFIIRYPEGKNNKSMYIAEPWHLRYVGKDLSKKLYNGGDWITLEEYFGIDSKYEEQQE